MHIWTRKETLLQIKDYQKRKSKIAASSVNSLRERESDSVSLNFLELLLVQHTAAAHCGNQEAHFAAAAGLKLSWTLSGLPLSYPGLIQAVPMWNSFCY